jgi:hypothetical protein
MRDLLSFFIAHRAATAFVPCRWPPILFGAGVILSSAAPLSPTPHLVWSAPGAARMSAQRQPFLDPAPVDPVVGVSGGAAALLLGRPPRRLSA